MIGLVVLIGAFILLVGVLYLVYDLRQMDYELSSVQLLDENKSETDYVDMKGTVFKEWDSHEIEGRPHKNNVSKY